MSTTKKTAAVTLTAALALGTLAACSGSGSSAGSDDKTVTLVSHDSFAASKSVLKRFEKESGYKVRVLKDGDAGEAVNKAILTKDHPQGDVLFGVDNTLLSRALDNGLFQRYPAKDLNHVLPEYRTDGKTPRVTPIDTGNICVNYDKKYFTQHHLAPPKTLTDLSEPAYKNLLVTENASTSSPGLGFLLGSAAEYGDSGWPGYWKKLKANGVKVVDTWEQAYDQEFSGSAGGRKAGGDRPLVVSYASSPPAEAIYTSPQPKTAPTGVATGTCFRQTEYAGLLAHAKNPKGGKALLDFLISTTFQNDMPLNMYVDPVRKDAQPPALYRKYAVQVDAPHTMAAAKIADHRDPWVKAWTSLVLK
ncbi:thiamine ABC transporter substrate-binding protein [Streptomyces odontomachi]|uniref:thiamine ABC transporter substrate-binding protein n=1 Tax=Streptomyces odontomachi TaxID=2944940 RepID=UPI002109DF64|nr:thiamine ABC transporter substrate-binding protein [Streptomyces sp. ODS25]